MWRRFGLSVVTVGLYVFISSVVIVLAQGYTVDIQARKILTTGVAEVDTYPQGAKVRFDGVDTKKITPTSLSHYVPGTYSLGIEFPGYQSVSFPIDILSELVTHVGEVALFPSLDNWRNLQFSAEILNVEAFPDQGIFLIQTADGISWWNIQKKQFVKIFSLPTVSKAEYSCVLEGNTCVVIDGNQAYFVDVQHRLSRKLKGMLVFHDTHSLYKFQGDYVVFAKQGGGITMQKIGSDGTIGTQIFEEDVDAFQVLNQDVWFVKNHGLWRQSLISGLPQRITQIDDDSGKVEALFVMTDYVIWQKTTGEAVLFDTELKAVINMWSQTKLFDGGKSGIALVQDAKVWLVSNERGLRFLGQATDIVDTIMPYGKMEWIARLRDGHYVLILMEPARVLPVDNGNGALDIIPYKGVIATTKGSDTLLYHLFPEQSWMQEFIKN